MTRYAIVPTSLLAAVLLTFAIRPGVTPASELLSAPSAPVAGLEANAAVGGIVSAARTVDGYIHGRVTTTDGFVHEGVLRFGSDEEALWIHQFNGVRAGNRWAEGVPEQHLPTERLGLELFGVEIVGWDRPVSLKKPFLARFGEVDRIDAEGRTLRVTLRSGTVAKLDRWSADDFADGVRIHRTDGTSLTLDEGDIRSIEFDGAPGGTSPSADAAPLHGTVHTAGGTFTGLLQWNREQGLVTDELAGVGTDSELRLRFDAIRSIVPVSDSELRVTRTDGHTMLLAASGKAGVLQRGVYVDDPRYGRLLVTREALEMVEFSTGVAPGRDAFQPGVPLTGEVTTLDGRRLNGRIVFDLDEAETTETLDAPSGGVTWMIPFGRITSLTLPSDRLSEGAMAQVELRSGERVELRMEGDLGELNAGILVRSAEGVESYLPWESVARIRFRLTGDGQR